MRPKLDRLSTLIKILGHTEPSESGCLEWRAAKNNKGYGALKALGESGAHRVMWAAINGPIPEGLQVLHSCDNPSCVRPGHLHLGTQATNILEAVSRGRMGHISRAVRISRDNRLARKLCPHGHPYDKSEKLQNGKTARRCSVCRREQMHRAGRRYYQKKQASA